MFAYYVTQFYILKLSFKVSTSMKQNWFSALSLTVGVCVNFAGVLGINRLNSFFLEQVNILLESLQSITDWNNHLCTLFCFPNPKYQQKCLICNLLFLSVNVRYPACKAKSTLGNRLLRNKKKKKAHSHTPNTLQKDQIRSCCRKVSTCPWS